MAYTVTYKRRTQTGKISTVRRRVAGNKPQPGPSIASRAGKMMHQTEHKAGQTVRSVERYVAPGAKRVLHSAERRAGSAVKSVQKSIKTYQSAPVKRSGVAVQYSGDIKMQEQVLNKAKTGMTWKTFYKSRIYTSRAGADFYSAEFPKGMRLSTRIERTGPFGLGRSPVTRVVKSPPKR